MPARSRRWVHTHSVAPAAEGRAELIDEVEYALPFGPLGAIAGGLVAQAHDGRQFSFRHRRIATDLARHRAIGQGRRLRLVLTGRAGFVLTQLAAFLSTGGHLVHVFPTGETARIGPPHSAWGPTAVPDFAALEQADAVIHIGLDALRQLLASLDERRSRAHTVIALPTVGGWRSAAGVDGERLAGHGRRRATRRVVVPAHAGRTGRGRRHSTAWSPAEALTPSVDGPLVGLDDLIGATYFAICDDAMRGFVDVTLPRAGETAALPAALRDGPPRCACSSSARREGRRALRHRARLYADQRHARRHDCLRAGLAGLRGTREIEDRTRTGSSERHSRDKYTPAFAFRKRGE